MIRTDQTVGQTQFPKESLIDCCRLLLFNGLSTVLEGVKKAIHWLVEKFLPVREWPIPEEGLFQFYLKWAGPRTEAPMAFHVASLLSAVAILLGRKCKIQVGDLTFYPVIYAICIGESTMVRKTHAVNMMRRVFKIVEEKLQLPHSLILADDGTPEGLLTELYNKNSGIKVFNEFGAFLKQIKKRDFLRGFTGLFTELFDCPDTYTKQLSKKSFSIDEPFLCIHGSTTREWLLDAMDETDITSGFLARFLFFPGESKTKLIPITFPRNRSAEEELAEKLASLNKISGTFAPTAEAESIYIDWYIRHRHELQEPSMALLSAYYGRLEGYVWKIAFIFEVTTNPNLESISAASVQLAIGFVERLKRDLKPLIQRDLQPSPMAKLLGRIRRMVQKAGPSGITRTNLLKNSHLTSKQLDMVIQTLKEREEIIEESAYGKKVYKDREFADSHGVRSGPSEV